MKRSFLLLSNLLLSAMVPAYVITFDNLPVDAEYNVGDSFVSDGVTITGEEYFWPGGTSTLDGFARVENGLKANGSGKEIRFNNINLDFDFAVDPIMGLSLQYGYYGGNINFEINGILQNVNAPALLHGIVVDGVSLTVVNAGAYGAIFATGEISSFSIGGQEFYIDNVIACIPEPATLGLLGLGALLIRRNK